MISLVLQHLESLQINLAAIDPAHRTDAVDRVAAMASALRDVAADAPIGTREPLHDQKDIKKQA